MSAPGLSMLLACASAAVSVWLLLPGRPIIAARPPPRLRLIWPASAVIGLVVLMTPQFVVPALIGGGALAAGARLLRRRAQRKTARSTAERVLEMTQAIASDLVAGQPPGMALARAAATWPALAPVAEAQALGGNVPAALRTAARMPGAGDLTLVAAAWQVAQRTGHGLADALHRTGATLRARQATRRVIDGELASARSTAWLVAGLPVLAWLMGSGAGGSPITFLLSTPLGLGCLGGGLVMGLAGLAWIEAIARGAEEW